jgi:DNA-binding PadR family transcriptional regulator
MGIERELLLLGMLRTQAMHGYQLHELINSHFGESIHLKKPTAYSLLNKMADAGWVSFVEEQAGNRPIRRVYAITEEGEATFQRLVRQNLADYKPADYLGSIALAFLDVVPPSEAVGLLRQRRRSVESLRQATQSHDEHHGSMQLLIENQVRHLSVDLEWLDEVIERTEGQQTAGG